MMAARDIPADLRRVWIACGLLAGWGLLVVALPGPHPIPAAYGLMVVLLFGGFLTLRGPGDA